MSSDRLMYVHFTSCVYWGKYWSETTRILAYFMQFKFLKKPWDSVKTKFLDIEII